VAPGLTGALADSEQRVFWLDSPEAPEPQPPLEGDLRCELAVAGGGFTGLWAALLAAPDEDVVVLEGDRCGWAASGRKGGFLDPSLTHGLENGLARWPDEVDRLLELGRENFDAIRGTLTSRGIDAAWEENGFIDVATRAHEVEELAESAESAREHGRDTELMRLELVRSRPLPFPPEPLRYAVVQATRRALARPDERRGKRGLWLRGLDRVGAGFDS
jgi:glycine/D-amino acid oxidase-like deaminating enzyme